MLSIFFATGTSDEAVLLSESSSFTTVFSSLISTSSTSSDWLFEAISDEFLGASVFSRTSVLVPSVRFCRAFFRISSSKMRLSNSMLSGERVEVLSVEFFNFFSLKVVDSTSSSSVERRPSGMNLFSDRTLSIVEVDEASSSVTSTSSSELSLVFFETIVEKSPPDLDWGLAVANKLILTTLSVGGGLWVVVFGVVVV